MRFNLVILLLIGAVAVIIHLNSHNVEPLTPTMTEALTEFDSNSGVTSTADMVEEQPASVVAKQVAPNPVPSRKGPFPNDVVSCVYNNRQYHFLLVPTSSFTELLKHAQRVGMKETILIDDLHFNSAGGNGYFPTQWCTKDCYDFSLQLNAESAAIYKEQGWKCLPARVSHKVPYTLLREAKKRGLAATISEPFFCDDKTNGLTPNTYFMSKAGQVRLAKAKIDAYNKGKYSNIFMSVGHNRTGKSSAAKIGDYSEVDFGYDLMRAIWDDLQARKLIPIWNDSPVDFEVDVFPTDDAPLKTTEPYKAQNQDAIGPWKG